MFEMINPSTRMLQLLNYSSCLMPITYFKKKRKKERKKEREND